jgi:hypothetical protein
VTIFRRRSTSSARESRRVQVPGTNCEHEVERIIRDTSS